MTYRSFARHDGLQTTSGEELKDSMTSLSVISYYFITGPFLPVSDRLQSITSDRPQSVTSDRPQSITSV